MQCQIKHDWIKWKDAMQAELDSLNKRNIFGSIILMPKNCETSRIQVSLCTKEK